MSDNVYSSPNSDVIEDDNAPVKLSLIEILFSFKGRINRSSYWYSALGMIVFYFILMFALGMLGFDSAILSTIISLSSIPLVWISLAIQVKRWHDRDKSEWFVLVSFIPIIGGIWALVENGFLVGTPGLNRFGSPQA